MLGLATLLAAACTSSRGAPCDAVTACGAPYVCASTRGPTLRRCLLPCSADVARTDTGAPIVLGALCADGSVCSSSDVGPVCYFLGSLPLGSACPEASCDPTTTICDCEPGTICQAGFCRQVCRIERLDTRDLDAPTDVPMEDAGSLDASFDADLDASLDGGRPFADLACPLAHSCIDWVCLPN